MFVQFGEGKCPLCGDFGKELKKEMFSCRSCDISFDKFMILFTAEPKVEQKFWN